jgi:hypothetical protein
MFDEFGSTGMKDLAGEWPKERGMGETDKDGRISK